MSHFEAMRCLTRFEKGAVLSGSVVTIGNFDGFHLGHQSLIHKVSELSHQEGLTAVAVTFSPHPREVIQPGLKIQKIFLKDEQAEFFREAGFEVLFRLAFDEELRRTAAAEFLKNLLEATSAQHLVVGHDFRLGADRGGDIQFLKKWCDEHHLRLHQIQPVLLDGRPVSSQRIREAIQGGSIDEARKNLGRSFALTAVVRAGDARGRQLGFPTANLSLDADRVTPKFGVYAGWAYVEKERRPAVANVGRRPTFAGAEPLCEVHILDFSGDLYGQRLKFEFVKFLREEKKFSGLEELKAQIDKDVQQARTALRERTS